jgi:hypothetical protein
MIRFVWCFTGLALLLLTAGCQESELVQVTGRVTYKGKGVPSTYVIFQPETVGKRQSNGLTDDNGEFTLDYSRSAKGVLRGKHTVFFKYYVSAAEEEHKVEPKASGELRSLIAKKYGDPKTSGIEVEVTRNGQFVEIELK